jgi:hypothetical protein
MEYVTTQEIKHRMPWVLDSPRDNGIVRLIVVRPQTDQRDVIEQAHFSPAAGVAGDNWQHDCWKRLADGRSDPDVQVAIMNARMIEVLAGDQTHWPLAGDQLFVDFDLGTANLSPGDQLKVGDAILEITAEPHRGCRKFKQRFGEQALNYVNSAEGDRHRLRGVYAKIIEVGKVETGDAIKKY